MAPASSPNQTRRNGSTVFHGSFRALARQMMVIVLPLAAAACFLLFGAIGWRLFLASLLLAPLFLALALVLTRMEGLTLDDAQGRVRRSFRRPIPYDQLDSLHYSEWMGLGQLTGRTRSGRSEILIRNLDAATGRRLLEAFSRRRPRLRIGRRQRSGWKTMVAMMGVVVLCYPVALYFLHREHPAATTPCTPVETPAAARTVLRTDRNLAIAWPEEVNRFHPVVLSPFDVGSIGRSGRWFLRLSGIRGEFGLFHYACCARFGIVPAVLKSVLLRHWSRPVIYEFHRRPRHNLCLAGLRAGIPGALVLLRNEDDGASVLISLRARSLTFKSRLQHLLPAFSVRFRER